MHVLVGVGCAVRRHVWHGNMLPEVIEEANIPYLMTSMVSSDIQNISHAQAFFAWPFSVRQWMSKDCRPHGHGATLPVQYRCTY